MNCLRLIEKSGIHFTTNLLLQGKPYSKFRIQLVNPSNICSFPLKGEDNDSSQIRHVIFVKSVKLCYLHITKFDVILP